MFSISLNNSPSVFYLEFDSTRKLFEKCKIRFDIFTIFWIYRRASIFHERKSIFIRE